MFEISDSVLGNEESLEQHETKEACFVPETLCTGSKEVESSTPTTVRKMHGETKRKETVTEKDILRCLFKI